MKKIKAIILLTLVMFEFLSCDVYRTVKYGVLPSQKDYLHFPQRKVENQSPTFYFKNPGKDYKLGSSIGLTNRSLSPTFRRMTIFRFYAHLHGRATVSLSQAQVIAAVEVF